jgi:hypothetical protein
MHSCFKMLSKCCHLGDGDVVCALLYQLGVCPASMQDRPVACVSDTVQTRAGYEVQVSYGYAQIMP